MVFLMGSLRFHLRRVAAAWLAFQLVGLIGAPLAVRLSAAVMEVCTCPGGDHQTCPMHHGQQNSSSESRSPRCVLQNACAPDDAALLPLAGGLGVLAPVTLVSDDLQRVDMVERASHTTSRQSVPDSPPPRS
jgi:hypothetical protein